VLTPLSRQARDFLDWHDSKISAPVIPSLMTVLVAALAQVTGQSLILTAVVAVLLLGIALVTAKKVTDRRQRRAAKLELLDRYSALLDRLTEHEGRVTSWAETITVAADGSVAQNIKLSVVTGQSATSFIWVSVHSSRGLTERSVDQFRVLHVQSADVGIHPFEVASRRLSEGGLEIFVYLREPVSSGTMLNFEIDLKWADRAKHSLLRWVAELLGLRFPVPRPRLSDQEIMKRAVGDFESAFETVVAQLDQAVTHESWPSQHDGRTQ
jgi:hypothetical protein